MTEDDPVEDLTDAERRSEAHRTKNASKWDDFVRKCAENAETLKQEMDDIDRVLGEEARR